jgi:fumarate reductase subunit D
MSTSAPHRRSPEPYLWLLFSAGGMAAALDAPDRAHMLAIVHNPLTKLALFGVAVLALFHWAHRFRFTVEHGLKLGRFDAVIALCCYGTAVLGSAAAAWVLLTA